MSNKFENYTKYHSKLQESVDKIRDNFKRRTENNLIDCHRNDSNETGIGSSYESDLNNFPIETRKELILSAGKLKELDTSSIPAKRIQVVSSESSSYPEYLSPYDNRDNNSSRIKLRSSNKSERKGYRNSFNEILFIRHLNSSDLNHSYNAIIDEDLIADETGSKEGDQSMNLNGKLAVLKREVASSPSGEFSGRNHNMLTKSQYQQQKQRRFSQDSGIVTGRVSSVHTNNSDPSLLIRRSIDNIRNLQIYQNSETQKLTITTSLNEEDDIIESPIIKEPPIEPEWVTTSSQATLVPKTDDQNGPLKSPTIAKAFGQRINAENIPGTPMVGLELMHDSPTFEKENFSNRSSINTIQDETKWKKLIINKFKNSSSRLDDTLTSTNDSSSYYHSKDPRKDFEYGNDDYDGNNSNDPSRRVSKQDKEGLDPESLMFRDGRRKIDMVLAWEEENEGVMTEAEARRRDNRRVFQENLMKEGLELELEDKSQSFDERTYFLKIHLPWRLETRYAEVMNLKLPVKRFITISVKDEDNIVVRNLRFWTNLYVKFLAKIQFESRLPEEEATFKKATAGANPEEQFIVKDRATTFTSAQRSLIVFQILLRTKYDDTEKSGIRRLLNDGAYLAAFPLHEGRYNNPHSSGALLDRRILYLTWARPSQWYKKQPLCLVRKYFGDKIALYFCWLGFYTQMLIYPAIVGTLCFLYGLASLESEDNTPSKEICSPNGAGNITLCPLCDRACSYQRLYDSCLFARLTYLFDNPSTVFFAIFMSFWATTFLELWKRKQSVIIWEWDLQNVEADEENRPEFEASVKTFRMNPVTREKEPYMPTWSRALRFIATGSAVLFMISVVMAAVLGTIIYRISLVSVIYGGGGFFVKKHAKLFTTITAALINLVVIMILTRIYHRLAIHLTNLENPRTHTEYEDSYTFKIFFFEFMNFYSSLIYIAFFKGRFFDYPGDDIARKSEFFRLKNDICDPAGCLSELCIQLAIIMVGKQCWNNFMEYLFPKFYNWWRQRKHRQATKDETHLHMSWEQDYHMQDPGRLALFDEYLEMILQYGFVTLFVAAFPLAPLFALLNNIAEIRLDAYKMVTQARRPLAERVEDIGAWYGILKIITYTAVVSNAFVIAYTSDFIPRMVYKFVYSETNTLEGYIEHSLSIFNTSDYKEEWGATSTEHDPDICKYRGYRNGPEHTEPYGLSPHYWHVFAARLAFVVVFEHVVFVITGIMQFIIPDIPAELKTQIQREQLLAKEAKYQNGLKKSQQDEYQELLGVLRQQGSIVRTSGGGIESGSTDEKTGNQSSWARRLSRISDGLDTHIEIPSRKKKSMESTVWEVT